ELTKKQIIGQKISQVYLKNQKEKISAIHQAVKEGKEITNRTKLVKKNGEKFIIVSNISSFTSGEDKSKIIAVSMDISELEDTREQLQESKEKLEATLNSIGEAVIVTDTEARVTRMNPVAEKLTGWSFVEARGKPLNRIFNIVNARTREAVENPTKKVLQEGKKTGLANDTVLVSKEGSEYQIADSAAPIRDKNKTQGVVLVFRDVTDEYQMREKLKESEDRFQKMLSVIPDMVSVHDSEMNVVYSNWKGIADILEKNRNLYSKCYRIYRDYDDICPDCQAKSVLEKKKPVQKEVQLPDDSWYDIRAIPMQEDENGNVQLFVEWIRNITERKKREEEIKSQKQRLQSIIAGTGAGTWEWNVQTGGIIINEKWAEMLGYTLKELEPVSIETWKELTHPDDLEKAEEMLAKHFKGEIEQYDIEMRMKHKQGHWVWMQDRGQVITWTDDGRPERMYGTHLDITDRKKREEKIKYISYHDSMTDLYNRKYMEKEIKKLDTKEKLPLGIVMTDINGLKMINNAYGHKKGDEILKQTADILKSCLRKDDTLARWAGDEFVILIPEANEKIVQELCGCIKEKIDKNNENQKEIPLSLGIGYAIKDEFRQNIYEIIYQAEDKVYTDKLTKSSSMKNKLVQNMLNTLGAKSYETKEHAVRMTNFSFILGEKIGLNDEKLNHLSLLATLHDIGKVNIAEDILKKPSGLSKKEWEKIKEHTEKGYAIAESIEEFTPIAESILSHHERWDGDGYPQGLAGKEIPLLARIISIVDAYDVMTNGRPYKKPMSKKEAIEELKRCAGSQFDPYLVEEFIEAIN
ncbi:MAG: PAS domain S-box protein, partial [Bacillota bacterium]